MEGIKVRLVCPTCKKYSWFELKDENEKNNVPYRDYRCPQPLCKMRTVLKKGWKIKWE